MKTRLIHVGLVATVVLLISACSGVVNGVPEERTHLDKDSSSIERGRQLIASYGCGSCHSIPGVERANAMIAPPLDRFYQQTYIAGRLPNTAENLAKWIQDPQSVEPGTAMPNLGVRDSEARDIVAYLYHQPTALDLVSR